MRRLISKGKPVDSRRKGRQLLIEFLCAAFGGPAGIRGAVGAGFALQRRFRAFPDRVFRAWTEPAALREWWCPPGWIAGEIAIDPRPGGTYRIEMRRIGDGERVAACNRLDRLVTPIHEPYRHSAD